jgi:hypothetical protein
LEHIHLNPIVAGFVSKPEEWKYSTTRDFTERKGLVNLSYNSSLRHKKAKAKAMPLLASTSGVYR